MALYLLSEFPHQKCTYTSLENIVEILNEHYIGHNQPSMDKKIYSNVRDNT